VADLAPAHQMANQDLVTVHTGPDGAQLRTAVGVQRHEMCQAAGTEKSASGDVEHCHPVTLDRIASPGRSGHAIESAERVVDRESCELGESRLAAQPLRPAGTPAGAEDCPAR